MTAIFIYHDYMHHAAPLYDALVQRYGASAVRFVNADDVADGILDTRPDAFVIPGGASRYKAAKLKGAGNAAIKSYVAKGGCYIGICAGAYYACRQTVWAAGTAHEIVMDGELGFFAGRAIGPIGVFSSANDRDGSDARIVMMDVQGERTPVLYWGGAQFVADAGAVYTTEATFTALPDNNAAIVSGMHGKGKWLLASPHIEMDDAALQRTTFDVADNRYADIAALGDTADVRLDVFNSLLDKMVAQ